MVRAGRMFTRLFGRCGHCCVAAASSAADVDDGGTVGGGAPPPTLAGEGVSMAGAGVTISEGAGGCVETC